MCGSRCYTSNNGRSWARNFGRLTSIIDLSKRTSSFSSGNFSCDMLNTGRERGWTLNKRFACAVTFPGSPGDSGIQPHCLCSFFTITVICNSDLRGLEHAFVSRSNFKMEKECGLGCDGAKIAVKMTQAYSFLKTAEMTQADTIQIWQNEKSEWELSRSGSSPAYFSCVRFDFCGFDIPGFLLSHNRHFKMNNGHIPVKYKSSPLSWVLVLFYVEIFSYLSQRLHSTRKFTP